MAVGVTKAGAIHESVRLSRLCENRSARPARAICDVVNLFAAVGAKRKQNFPDNLIYDRYIIS